MKTTYAAPTLVVLGDVVAETKALSKGIGDVNGGPNATGSIGFSL